MNWFAFSLFSITALALAELTQQHLLNADNPIEERTSAVLTFLVQALFTIPIILLTDLSASFLSVFRLNIFPYMILVTLVASVAMIYYLRSFKVKNISISTIFVSLSIVVSTTLGIIFFNEGFYFYKLLGISLVLIALVSLNIRNFNLERNHYFGLIAGVLFGIAFTLDKKLVMQVHPVIYIFWTFTLISLTGFISGPKTVMDVVKKSKLIDYRPIVFSGIGYFLYNLFTFTAYTVGGEVGRVDAVNNSQVFIIILVEYFIFRHHQGLLRKLATATLAFAGILILGYL